MLATARREGGEQQIRFADEFMRRFNEPQGDGGGDGTWDMVAAKRCRALGIGLLSRGYGLAELQQSGAFRVFEDSADLLLHIEEVGARR